MTDREALQQVIVAKLREHADFLKHNVATWQLLARAADEIERPQARIARMEAGRDAGDLEAATEQKVSKP